MKSDEPEWWAKGLLDARHLKDVKHTPVSPHTAHPFCCVDASRAARAARPGWLDGCEIKDPPSSQHLTADSPSRDSSASATLQIRTLWLFADPFHSLVWQLSVKLAKQTTAAIFFFFWSCLSRPGRQLRQ